MQSPSCDWISDLLGGSYRQKTLLSLGADVTAAPSREGELLDSNRLMTISLLEKRFSGMFKIPYETFQECPKFG